MQARGSRRHRGHPPFLLFECSLHLFLLSAEQYRLIVPHSTHCIFLPLSSDLSELPFQQADPPVTATQAVAEIDDLFAGLSRHKQTVAAAAAAAAAAEIKKKKKEQELKQKNSEREAREGREGQRYDPKRDDPDVRPCK